MHPTNEAKAAEMAPAGKPSSPSPSPSETTTRYSTLELGAANDNSTGPGVLGPSPDGGSTDHTISNKNKSTKDDDGRLYHPGAWGKENASNKRPCLDGTESEALLSATSSSDAFRPWQDLWDKVGKAKRLAESALNHAHKSTDGAGPVVSSSAQGRGGSGDKRKSEAPEKAGTEHHPPKQPRNHWTMAQVAREKTEKVMALERELTQSQSQISALDASNAALRDENRQLQARLDKTAHALRIAGQNASKAREDAAQAETTAAALSDQLRIFQTVTGETKQAIQILTEEHRNITEDVRKVEARLVQALAKDATTTARYRQLKAQHGALEAQAEESRKVAAAWQGRHERAQEQVRDLEHSLDRAKEHNTARRAHTEQLAADHQQAVALLEASTRANQESDEAFRELRESNRNLKEELARQASELSEHRAKAQREKDRLNESYTKALTKAQHLELQLETLKAGAAAKEKEWQRERKTLMGLNSHGANVSTAAVTPTARAIDPTARASGSGEDSVPSTALSNPSLAPVCRIPPLSTYRDGGANSGRGRSPIASLGSTETPSSSSTGTTSSSLSQTFDATCCIVCLKPAVLGIVKHCQCGRSRCHKRAHADCVLSASASTSSMPLILCANDMGDGDSTGGGSGTTGRNSSSVPPSGPGL